jgi:DNA-binding GntR family transcriptional regulator
VRNLRVCFGCASQPLPLLAMTYRWFKGKTEKGICMKNRIPDEVLKDIFQKKLEKRNMNGDLYQRLKRMILSGKLKEGQKLIQEGIALHFNVSRQTVRNAFLRLEKDRLIISRYRKGAFVSHKS